MNGLDQTSRRNRIRPFVLGGAAVVVLAGVVAALAFVGDGSEAMVVQAANEPAGITTTVPPLMATRSHRDLSHLPVPDGVIPIADHEGNLVGYVDSTAEYSTLKLDGKATKLRAIEVVDDRGEVVGYDVIALGFVDLVEAQDPAALEERLAKSEAITKEFLENEPPPTIPAG